MLTLNNVSVFIGPSQALAFTFSIAVEAVLVCLIQAKRVAFIQYIKCFSTGHFSWLILSEFPFCDFIDEYVTSSLCLLVYVASGKRLVGMLCQLVFYLLLVKFTQCFMHC